MKTGALAFLSFAIAGCLGGYQSGTPGTPATQGSPTTNGNTSGSSGSGGGASTTPPPPTSAKSLFDANAASILTAKCAATACHGGTATNPPPFAAGPSSGLYMTVLNYADILLAGFDKTQAQILLKITPGNHNGCTYSSGEVTSIGGWLDAERAARAGGGGTVSPRDALLAKWSGCMTQADFDSAGVATAWARKTTDTSNTACQQCHDNADAFLANADSTRMFNILSSQPNPKGGWFLEYMFTVDTTDPNNLQMIINRDYINRAATGTGQHELFQIDTDRNGANPSAYQCLTTFYQLTLGHLAAGPCGPPRITTP
jgi:hypothetical protein